MLHYYTIVKDSSPYYFYNADNSVLFHIERKYIFPKYLFTIKDHQGKDILIFEVRNILSTRIKILFQDFEEKIILTKNKIVVGTKVISIIENFRLLEKYKSLIMVNDEIAGEIYEEPIFPYKKYILNFNGTDNMNYYCLVLFAIISVHFADGI